jgi:hypothetical protein
MILAAALITTNPMIAMDNDKQEQQEPLQQVPLNQQNDDNGNRVMKRIAELGDSCAAGIKYGCLSCCCYPILYWINRNYNPNNP